MQELELEPAILEITREGRISGKGSCVGGYSNIWSVGVQCGVCWESDSCVEAVAGIED